MTIKECYSLIGGDYNDVVGRFGGERLIDKYLGKFLQDKSFEELTKAMSRKDYAEAFRMAHTLKGICQNLSLNKLYFTCSKLTEGLRDGCDPNIDTLYEEFVAEYQKERAVIKQYKS